MLAFGRDLLSPLLNLGWFVGCLLAVLVHRAGRTGSRHGRSALGAIALSLPALADQAGEARNDIVGIFFLLAAVAIALNAWAQAPTEGGPSEAWRVSDRRALAALAGPRRLRPAWPPGPSSTSCCPRGPRRRPGR